MGPEWSDRRSAQRRLPASTEQPSSSVKGTVASFATTPEVWTGYETLLTATHTVSSLLFAVAPPLREREKRLSDSLPKSDVMELDGGKS